MNLEKPETQAVAQALGQLENWLATMRGDGGYYGPVVGLRGTAMGWCGPGHDWRWEGLLDGWVARHRRTGSPVYLERVTQALTDLRQAQQANGTFRNSYFENNPFEGGMPYEPAMMAAVLRAVRYLQEQQKPCPVGTTAMIERFVEQRLIKELWNKVLRTFNSWLQSDFEVYSPPAVAAIVETLCDYAELTGTESRVAPYLEGAAASLLHSQLQKGPLAGALPVSNREGASASPYLAARCLPALVRLHRRSGETPLAAAADALTDFVAKAWLPTGGLPFMVYANRPPRTAPLFIGAAAGTLVALDRAGRLEDAAALAPLRWLLARQTASGAFDTAVGFGTGAPAPARPDWRDVLPVCGWADKVYDLLTRLGMDPVPAAAAMAPVNRPVLIKGQPAEFAEDADSMALRRGKEDWFVWKKRQPWPEVCRL